MSTPTISDWIGAFGADIESLFGITQSPKDISKEESRALGFNPETGAFTSPAYADTFAQLHPGMSVAELSQDASNRYVNGLVGNFSDLGGASILPFSPPIGGDASVLRNIWKGFSGDGNGSTSGIFLIVAVVVIIAVFLVFKAVK